MSACCPAHKMFYLFACLHQGEEATLVLQQLSPDAFRAIIVTHGCCWCLACAQCTMSAGAQEVIDLSEEHQAQLWREVAAASRALRKCMRPDKLNIGAIGNQARPQGASAPSDSSAASRLPAVPAGRCHMLGLLARSRATHQLSKTCVHACMPALGCWPCLCCAEAGQHACLNCCGTLSASLGSPDVRMTVRRQCRRARARRRARAGCCMSQRSGALP